MASENPNTITSWRHYVGGRRIDAYDVLASLRPGLMLDVGAAAGMMTKTMLSRSPQSTVIAFEPFPGNHPHFARIVGDDPRVTLVKAAVGSKVGEQKFLVGRTVTGSEKGWEKFAGYSSAGSLIGDDYGRESESISVSTVGIDDTIGDRHVRFVKIDVQGGEIGVLQSAERAISEHRIDFMLVEFTGHVKLLEYLLERRMTLFDAAYTLVPKRRRSRFSWKAMLYGTDRADLTNWDISGTGTLSTGIKALRAWPRATSRTLGEFCLFLKEERRRAGRFWTDLIVVAPHFREEFTTAVSATTSRA